MTAKLSHSGQVHVFVCHTHYGHDKSLQHLRIPALQREMIASKLQQGVSRDRILEDIRDDFSSKFQRKHLIEKQDIVNIERAFGLRKLQRHANDQQSTLSWISDWEESTDNPVLYYKLQGEEAEDGYDLAKDDFFLVVQTPFQREMLLKFAQKGICCDSTHGTNGYDFLLTTIHVIDEFGEGVPAAWCISSHEDYTTMVIFMNEIKKRCGNIHSQYFMSDMANQFYNAWIAVMESRPQKLLCTWHVDKGWKEELRKKVGDVTLEAEVYKFIRTCLEQTSETSFDDSLRGLLKRLECDPKTQDFHAYFVKEWVSKKAQWAFCYRLQTTVNTNMFSEAFHRVFKRVYLGGKVNKRVDVCLVNLVKFSRDKAFDRAIKLTKGKTTYRTSVIASKHKENISIPDESVHSSEAEPGKWFVLSKNGKQKHEVTVVSLSCPEENQCKMICPDCKVCMHMLECDCPDWLIVGTICTHIHAVWRLVSPTAIPYLQSAQVDKSSNEEELASLSSCMRDVSHSDATLIKERIREKIVALNTEIDTCNNEEALSTLEKQLGAAYSTFTAVKKYGRIPTDLIPTQSASPPNKRMETQRRFHSTKRKRVNRKTVRYARPTIDEKELYFNILTSASLQKDPSKSFNLSLGKSFGIHI
ncbi:uncharacterized protein LOC114961482 [Acropora millepora]|uniref:uncharacterized protein LOC114961482 n=1 Tax=Acropora millepora TaxID=45264 RepID=UPI001CF1DE5B|nr:uncharacterized protein LOC114961482 [Acropora millepora]